MTDPEVAAGTEPAAENGGRLAKILERTRVGGGLALAVALLLWLAHATGSGDLVLGVGAVLAGLAVLEAARLLEAFPPAPEAEPIRPGGARLPMFGALLGVVAFLAFARHREELLFGGPASEPAWRALALLGVCFVLALGLAGLLASRAARGGAAAFAVWVVPALPALVLVWDKFGPSTLVSLIVLSKFGDVAGYYGGNAFGRHHPFPRLSPGKTTEGCLASLVGNVAMAWFLHATGILNVALLPALVAGAAINLAAQAGDLLESAAKRRAGIKDSGTLFGPSGGALDVVDSLLLTVPTLLLLGPFLF